jgi:serine/threonine protein kinase
LEYCGQGDLFDFLKHRAGGPLPKSVADTLFTNILDCVECMHTKAEVAHLDLKLENVLLTDHYEVKLCDLGFSQSIHNRVYRAVGTDGYKAPEIHKLTRMPNEDEQMVHSYSGS